MFEHWCIVDIFIFNCIFTILLYVVFFIVHYHLSNISSFHSCFLLSLSLRPGTWVVRTRDQSVVVTSDAVVLLGVCCLPLHRSAAKKRLMSDVEFGLTRGCIRFLNSRTHCLAFHYDSSRRLALLKAALD